MLFKKYQLNIPATDVDLFYKNRWVNSIGVEHPKIFCIILVCFSQEIYNITSCLTSRYNTRQLKILHSKWGFQNTIYPLPV